MRRKTISNAGHSEGGGDKEVCDAAYGATKGMRPGPGTRDKQNPGEQRMRKQTGIFDDGGARVEAWVSGKRGSYK